MMQSALAKERREIKQAAREAQADAVPKDTSKKWSDPIPDGKNPVHLLHVFLFIRNQFIRNLGLDYRHFQYIKVS